MRKGLTRILIQSVFFFPAIVFCYPLVVQDTCIINDECFQAMDIPGVVSDQSFVCLDGCNLYASPESFSSNCQLDIFPTVWYKVTLDNQALIMNLFVSTAEFESPVLQVFKSNTGCNNLEKVYLNSGNLECIVGTNGLVSVQGTSVLPNTTYYIAISSQNSIGGHFQFCLNVVSSGTACVVESDIQVTARSNGGPLEGPFDPAETVSICMNVNRYTAAGNGCQWFQGLVPVFGNGWDPASFNNDGQPINATLNGYPFGLDGNGLYGTSTWDWFTDVDYHYDTPNLTVADFDHNGTVDMCNSKYDMNCPQQGIIGGCCGPCWGTSLGTILPPGWFAYGINGTCPVSGPPIRVDWGDGNSCRDEMGPWQFCFDLVTRDVPDCQQDSTTRDLSVGFFTFADGETGSWTGSASVCALDRPMKLTLEAKCGRIVSGNVEQLPPLCSGDTLRYQLSESDVTNWEWNISPFWAVPYLLNQGINGVEIAAPLWNTSGEPVNISGVFIGHRKGSNDLYIRTIKFILNDAETCSFVNVSDPDDPFGNGKNNFQIYPSPVTDIANLRWSFELIQDADIEIYNSQGIRVLSFPVAAYEQYQKQINVQALEPGVYIVRLYNTAVQYVTKLVKL